MSKTLFRVPSPSVLGENRPARRRRKEARPGELMAAAMALFVEKGFSATRLEDVAAKAGVSKGTLYLYFDSKEALFKAVVDEAIVPLLVAAEQEAALHEGAAPEQLRKLLFDWWQQIGCTPLAGIPKLIIAEARNFPEVAQHYYENVIVRCRGLIRMVLLRGIARKEFRDVDVDTALEAIMAPLLMLVIWESSMLFCERGHSPEDFLKTHIDLLLHGLQPVR